MTGERQPIIAEDRDGTGFACDEYYQIYLGEGGGESGQRAHMNGLHFEIFGERGEWDESD